MALDKLKNFFGGTEEEIGEVSGDKSEAKRS